MTPLEKYDKMREQCRVRAARFYKKHIEKIGEKRKAVIQAKKLEKKEKSMVFNFETVNALLENTEKITNDNTRKAHMNRMKTFFEITACENIEVCLLDYETIINVIDKSTFGKNNTPYKVNSKKNIMESFLFCLDNLDIVLNKKIREKYQDYYGTIKITSNDELLDKKTNEKDAVISWPDYEQKVKEKFGVDSKQYLLIKIYEICLARDNFDLYITNDIETVSDDKTKNYLINEDGKYTLCMQFYKTSKNKEPIFIKVTPELKKLLDNYIKTNKIEDRLFPTKNGKNTAFVIAMHKKIDVPGGINIIRHIIISTRMAGPLTVEERLQLSKDSFHSINTQPDYKRMLSKK